MMKYLVIALLLTISAQASATVGTRDGGGGIGVRCGERLELLDLHEARLNGLKNPYSPQSEKETIDDVTTLFGNLMWVSFNGSHEEYKSALTTLITPMFDGGSVDDLYKVKYVDSLPLTDDVGKYKIRPGCHLEQIAYFDDTISTLFIAKNWRELDWIDRGALVMHELVYYADRRNAMEYFEDNIKMTSVRARAFVGHLFSTATITPHSDSIPNSGYAVCSDTKNDDNDLTFGYFYDDGKGNLSSVMVSIHGRDSVYQMKATYPGVSLSSLMDVNKSIGQEAPLVFSDENDAPEFKLRISRMAGKPVSFDILESKWGEPVPIASSQDFECWFPRQ